jgi:hypothetical protein
MIQLMVLTVRKSFRSLKKINVFHILSFRVGSGLKKNPSWETDGTLGVILTISICIFLLLPVVLPILLLGFGG